MVGYSALTQENEALALDLLNEHRKILRPLFEKHEGKEIETAGDSFFVEFNSAVEATICAIEIQAALHERNNSEAKKRQILLRIGLHIGDVVYVDKHVHGDGVNIAARMEPLAKPGGICISEDVARQIRNKVEFPVLKLAKEKLKNISMPVEVYCIVLPWLKPDERVKGTFSRKKTAFYASLFISLIVISILVIFIKNFPSQAVSKLNFRLAVLPLANIGNDSTEEYFTDGMTEELISSLSKISGLDVIARTSILKYKATNKDIAQIGDELMVGRILEGSVRRSANKVRITVQLINVSTQDHLWSEEYDRELKDVFMIQSEIARDVAKELKVRLVSSERQQLEKTNTQNMFAFQEYLVGEHFLNQRTPESIQTAIIHFEESTKLDTAFALSYTSLAYCYTLIGVAGYGSIRRNVAEMKAKKAVMKALWIDESLAEAHAALGYIKFRIDWDWKGAEKELRRAIELKPGYSTAHEWYALFLAVHARLDEALKEIQIAYQLDPRSPSVNTGLARIYHFRNESDKALTQIAKTLELDSNYAEAHFTEAMTYFKIKEYAKAALKLEKAAELSGRRPVMLGTLGKVYLKLGRIEEAKKILAELESPPMNDDKLYATLPIKSGLGHSEEVLKILEKLLEKKYGILIYMKVEKGFFDESNNPRYHQMLQKIGL